MPMLKFTGIPQSEVLEKSKALLDDLERIIECPRDYFTLEVSNHTFVFDGEIVAPPTQIDVLWFDRGQTVQNAAAQAITQRFQNNRECLDVVFHNLEASSYYENGKHF
ncbi:MAG: DUF1904 family protein [Bacilli bacterium]